MEFSPLQTALIRTPPRNNGKHKNKVRSTKAAIRSIFTDIYPPSDKTVAAASATQAEIPGELTRRHSLVEKYKLHDETKRQLMAANIALQRTMEELSQTNESLQRQMAIQKEEYAFAKAQWTDHLLDLHGEWDSKLMELKRHSETKANALLERELDEMRNLSLQQQQHSVEQQQKHPVEQTTHDDDDNDDDDNDDDDNDDDDNDNDDASPPRRLEKQLEELQQQHAKERAEWEESRSHLQDTIHTTKQEIEDAETRIQWLEKEMLAIFPSDTDDDDDNDNDTDEKEDPKSDLERHLKEVLLNSNTALQREQQAGHDQRIKELEEKLQELAQEKGMDEGMHYRQMLEMKKTLQVYQQRLQQAEKSLLSEERTRDTYYTEWTQRIETLELENQTLQQTANKWQKQCEHQTSLLKRQIRSLQTTLSDSARREEALVQREMSLKQKLSYQARQQPPTPTITMTKHRTKHQHQQHLQHLQQKYETPKQDNPEKDEWMARIDKLESQLTQAKGREAILDQRLADQTKATEAKETELEDAQQRIDVLMTYVEN
jgi:hypothetical protein